MMKLALVCMLHFGLAASQCQGQSLNFSAGDPTDLTARYGILPTKVLYPSPSNREQPFIDVSTTRTPQVSVTRMYENRHYT